MSFKSAKDSLEKDLNAIKDLYKKLKLNFKYKKFVTSKNKKDVVLWQVTVQRHFE